MRAEIWCWRGVQEVVPWPGGKCGYQLPDPLSITTTKQMAREINQRQRNSLGKNKRDLTGANYHRAVQTGCCGEGLLQGKLLPAHSLGLTVAAEPPGWWAGTSARLVGEESFSCKHERGTNPSWDCQRACVTGDRRRGEETCSTALLQCCLFTLSSLCSMQAYCRATERFRGFPIMDRTQGRPGLASTRAEFPAAALNPLQLPVISGPFRRAQAPRNGSASRTPPALTNKLISALSISKVCISVLCLNVLLKMLPATDTAVPCWLSLGS